jgi:hypothetical protein
MFERPNFRFCMATYPGYDNCFNSCGKSCMMPVEDT